MALPIFSAILLVCPLISSAHAYNLNFARLVSQERTTYNGGWALGLPGPTCPSDAPVACQDDTKVINPTCCPFGQICFGFTDPYCCPTDEDCGSVVNNLPVCANSTWDMYALNSDGYICCEPGQVGLNPVSGFAGLCEPADQPVQSSLLATLASQIGGPPITTGQRGAAATATTTLAGNKATATTTKGGATATSMSGAADSSEAKSILQKWHLSLGELIGIAVGGVVLIIVLSVLAWRCCCRSQRRTKVTYAEPYRNVDGYSAEGYAAEGYDGGYKGTSAYAGSENLPLQSGIPMYSPVSSAYAVPGPHVGTRGLDTAELGYDERVVR